MESTTIAKDQQTLVIGGLVQDSITITENKIPLLGDIPFLGWLFKSQSNNTQKLSLLVFLTPQIVRDEADMVELNARKANDVNALQREGRVEEPTKVKQEIAEKLERPNGPSRPSPPNGELQTPMQR